MLEVEVVVVLSKWQRRTGFPFDWEALGVRVYGGGEKTAPCTQAGLSPTLKSQFCLNWKKKFGGSMMAVRSINRCNC